MNLPLLGRIAQRWGVRPSELISDLKAMAFDLAAEQEERRLAELEQRVHETEDQAKLPAMFAAYAKRVNEESDGRSD